MNTDRSRDGSPATGASRSFDAASDTGRRLHLCRCVSVAILASSMLIGCASIGPRHIVHDRFDYADALSRSWKENMLLNLVKLRYADAPLFLDVSSIVEQYSRQGQLAAGTQYPVISGVNPSNVGGTVEWADRPTISYQPLTGSHFTRSLLTPMKPVEVMNLIQSGWPVAIVFRFGVRSINGVRAGTLTHLTSEAADPRFAQLVEALGRLQEHDNFGVREEKKGDQEIPFIVLPRSADTQVEADRRFVVDTLGLDPARSEYRLSFGAVSAGKDEIAVVTRTVFEILGQLSFDVQVPPQHEADGRVGPPLPAGIHRATSLHVLSGVDRPASAFTAVRYQDYWFWIDNQDFASKRTLSFMMILLALAETGGAAPAPALTLPAGQ